MHLEEVEITNRGYRQGLDDDRFYEYRIGGFRMDDGSTYGFKVLETDEGAEGGYLPTEDDPERAVRLHENDLDLDDRLPGLTEEHLLGYGEAIAQELEDERERRTIAMD